MSPASRMLSAISFGVLRRSAPSTSAIIRSRNDWPGSCVTSDDEPVGEQPRAAGDRRAVAAGLADHWRRLTGDRGLVHRADALDHLAVGGDGLTRGDDDHVALLELGRGDVLDPAAVGLAMGGRGRPGRAECVRLRLAAALGDRLREVGEQHGQPEPDRDRAHEPEPRQLSPRARSRTKIPVVIALPSSTMNITGLWNCWRGSSFGNESRIAASTSSREKTPERLAAVACCGSGSLGRCRRLGHLRPSLLVEREVELQDVHARLAEKAQRAAVGVLVDQPLDGRERQTGAPRRRAVTAERA